MPKKYFLPPYTTTAARTAATPLDGELLYDVETKQLYLGDGVTQGGNKIQGELWLDTAEKTADYTANNIERIPVNTTSGVVNITVPATGDRFWVYDAAATDNLTGFAANSCFILPRAGQTVRGGASFELDRAGLGLGFKKVGTNWVNYNG